MSYPPSPNSSAASNATPGLTPSPTTRTAPPPIPRPPGSRVPSITPAPPPANITPRIPLATASSPTGSYALPPPMGGGPTSASYVVPPRPKPGRKPATDEPASKRKAQNRESQRAFRARKAAKLTEMQAQVENTEQRHRREINESAAKLAALNKRIRELEDQAEKFRQNQERALNERDYWKERAAISAAELMARNQPGYFPPMPDPRQDSPTRQSLGTIPQLYPTGDYSTPKTVDLGCGNCKANGECACMEEIAALPQPISNPSVFISPDNVDYIPSRASASPIKDFQSMIAGAEASAYDGLETDYTEQYASKQNRLGHPASAAFATEQNEVSSRCGFCTDDSNCLCKDETLHEPNGSQRASENFVFNNRGDVKPVVDDGTTSGPGSCSDCIRNPHQRAWCQRIAQLREDPKSDLPTPSTSRHSSVGSPLAPIEPRSDYPPITGTDLSARPSIGCSEAYKLFEGRVALDQDKMDWSNLKPTSSAVRRDTLPPLREYSALELDTAGVIATLQQSMAPLAPRTSDGTNADLVRLAQQNHRPSHTPPPSDRSDEPLPAVSTIMDAIPDASWR